MITAIRNTVAEGISKLCAWMGSPITPKYTIEYENYVKWRDAYFAQHRLHPSEAQAKLGLAFCQHYRLHDPELADSTDRIYSEMLIFSRHVARYRTLN